MVALQEVLVGGEVKGGPNVYLLSPEQITHYWPQIEVALDATGPLWSGEWTKAALYDATLEQNVQVWVVSENEIITLALMSRIYETLSERVLLVFWASGKDLLEALPSISALFEKLARGYGCSRIETRGRPGIGKLVERIGGRFAYSVFTRRVPQTLEQ